MPDKNSGTQTEGVLESGRNTRNTLGMSQKDYDEYRQNIINKYDKNRRLSIREIARREQEKGIKLYPDRIARWLTAEGVDIRTGGETLAKRKGGSKTHSVYLHQEQYDILKQFDNMSEVMRMGIDIVLGLDTRHICLFLGEGKNVVFLFDYNIVEAYITADLTEFEQKTVQTLINKAKQHGPRYIINFAIENELTYYGGQIKQNVDYEDL